MYLLKCKYLSHDAKGEKEKRIQPLLKIDQLLSHVSKYLTTFSHGGLIGFIIVFFFLNDI